MNLKTPTNLHMCELVYCVISKELSAGDEGIFPLLGNCFGQIIKKDNAHYQISDHALPGIPEIKHIIKDVHSLLYGHSV